MQFVSPPPCSSTTGSLPQENWSPPIRSTDISFMPVPTVSSKPNELVLNCAPSSSSFPSSFSPSFSSSSGAFSSILPPDFCNRARRGRGRPRGSRASRPRVSRRAAVAAVWANQQQFDSALKGRRSRMHTGADKYARIGQGADGMADWPTGSYDDIQGGGEHQDNDGQAIPTTPSPQTFGPSSCTTISSSCPLVSSSGGNLTDMSALPCSPSEDHASLSATSTQLMYSFVSHAISEDAPKLSIPTFSLTRSLGPNSVSSPVSPPPVSPPPVVCASDHARWKAMVCHINLKAVSSSFADTERMVLELPAAPLNVKSSPRRGPGGRLGPVVATG
eukprot:GHVS01021835.1.p1 GENE.GHVS01021835.1~~GHVS01021835.1.p1  ORF type:complete len:332 (+),score=63.42 GHVS01021835.1:113-1108(+)